MLTVLEAAERIERDPETIRAWIGSGRLAARTVGTEHVIEEVDLEAAVVDDRELWVPESWRYLPSGRPAPNVVGILREQRDEH
jgi:hypothetical protein